MKIRPVREYFSQFLFSLAMIPQAIAFIKKKRLWEGVLSYGWVSRILLIGADWRIPATFIAVAIALMITGYTSSRLAGSPTGRAVARNVVGGALAMGVTYAVGSLLGTAI